ncbi:MAG: hypothetical protein NTV31_11610 [Bacteroidia bacterium]|nr:hypothetical protein [Bacteroidia bacterium]
MIFTYYQNKESYQPSYFLMWELPQLLTSGTTRESFESFKAGRITKEQLPIIIVSGQVEPGKKTNDNVRYHSGIIMLDLDRKDNLDIERKIKDINNDRFTYFSFSSPNRGYKVCIYTSIENVKEHAEYYGEISDYYSKTYDVKCDNRCRNIARFCFLPFDDKYYHNPLSERYTLEKGTSAQLNPKTNAEKRDTNNIEKRDSSTYTYPRPFLTNDSEIEKRDTNTYTLSGYNIDSLIKKGTYADLIFNITRYKNIMYTVVPFFQENMSQNHLDYSTRIDESYFSETKQTHFVSGGIPVCQIRLGKTFKIKTGNRNKTLGCLCLKLIFNNPFASCERILQELLSINEKYCEEPLSAKECNDIVRNNYENFLKGNLDFSKVLRQNKNGISKQYVFFSRKFKSANLKEKHKIACNEYKTVKKTLKTDLIYDAIERLKTGRKITIHRIADYLDVSEKMIDRNLTSELKELYKSYNRLLGTYIKNNTSNNIF